MMSKNSNKFYLKVQNILMITQLKIIKQKLILKIIKQVLKKILLLMLFQLKRILIQIKKLLIIHINIILIITIKNIKTSNNKIKAKVQK